VVQEYKRRIDEFVSPIILNDPWKIPSPPALSLVFSNDMDTFTFMTPAFQTCYGRLNEDSA